MRRASLVRSLVLILANPVSFSPDLLAPPSLRRNIFSPATILAWDWLPSTSYSVPGSNVRTMGEDLERLKQRLPLLEYLQQHDWTGRPVGTGSEFVGLCPLHEETHPSFYVNPHKNLFYCHGCGRGGDLIRFLELSRHLSFRSSIAYLRELLAPSAQLLEHTASFYQLQLSRHPEAVHYLLQRGLREPAVIEELGSGDAPGGKLRAHLSDLGYSLELLLQTGLIGPQGSDAFCRRVIFPCRQNHRILNLYGRCSGTNFAIPRIAESTSFSIRTTTRLVNKPLWRSPIVCTSPVSPRGSFACPPARIPTVSSWQERAATILSVAWRRLSPHDFSTHSAELFSAERLSLSVARRARP